MNVLRSSTLAILALSLTIAACAASPSTDLDADEVGSAATPLTTTRSPVRFIGVDHDWFNAANWSTGRVPGPNDDVELAGTDDVLIDRAAQPIPTAKVVLRDIHVRAAARLEVVGGAIVQSRDEVLHGRGQIIFRESGDEGDRLLVAPPSDADPSVETLLVLNPPPKSKRILVLQSGVTVDVGLGGTTPASLTRTSTGETVVAAGPGHYSTMTAEMLALDGALKLSLYYGFDPAPGDTFQIATATRRTGQFRGLPEGAFVGCTDKNVCLRISYRGGDGNDVVLRAEPVAPAVAILLPAVQRVREAAAR